jgi:hypothetical protein
MSTNSKTKHEREVSDAIYDVAKAIEQYLGPLSGWRTCQIERELYYDQDGSNPSRFLEYYLNRNTSLRVAVQRNEKIYTRLTCYWTTFKDGQSINEGQFNENTETKLIEKLKKVLDQHAHLVT